MAVVFAVDAQGTHNQKPRPDPRARRSVAAFLRGMGRLWRGWAAYCPLSRCPRAVRIGNTTSWVFTKHETRTLSPFGSPGARKGRITKNLRPVTVSGSPFAWHGAASRGKGRLAPVVPLPPQGSAQTLTFSMPIDSQAKAVVRLPEKGASPCRFELR